MSYELRKNGDKNLYIADTNTRVLIVPVETIGEMARQFRKLVGPAARVLMREVGRSFGHALGDVIRKEREAGDLQRALQTFFEKCGFGRVTVEERGGKVVVTLDEPPSLVECSHCDFESGVLAGLLEELSGSKWKVQVEKLDKGCRITATRA
jgi:predicted hydrocarbon binding protein